MWLAARWYGHIFNSMAIPRVKSTYSLDVDTIRTLEAVARRWGVSKSEALRRAIHAAAGEATVGSADPTKALDQLQASLELTAGRARTWAARAHAERRASSARRERPAR